MNQRTKSVAVVPRSKSVVKPERKQSKVIPRNKSLISSKQVETINESNEIDKMIKQLTEENKGLQLRLSSQQDFDTIVLNINNKREELEKILKQEREEQKKLIENYYKLQESKLFFNVLLNVFKPKNKSL